MVPRSPHPRRTFRRPGRQSYAAFLQNASVLRVAYPGFHPGLVCCAPLGHSGDPPNHTPLQHTPLQHTTSQHTTSQHPGRSGTLAVARLGGEHHTQSRAARKPILSGAYSARGGHGPAELAPETHLSKAWPTERCGVPSERFGLVCRVPRVSPWAGMPRPVGALRRSTQPTDIA